MSIESAFDIQQIKNSSVRQKNALQAEWQETIAVAGRGNDMSTALLADLQLDEERYPSMLPNVVLALNYRNRVNAGVTGHSGKAATSNGSGLNTGLTAAGLSSYCVTDWSH